MDNSEQNQPLTNQPPDPISSSPPPESSQPAPQTPEPMPLAEPVAPTVSAASEPMTPPVPQQSVAPAPQPQKKSRLWLWITLTVVGALLVAAAVTIVVGISSANSAAKTYTTDVKTYLSDVADALSGSATSPKDIEKEVDDVARPELKKAFLGALSDDYKNATKTQDDVNGLIGDTAAELKKYSEFVDYSDKARQAENGIISSEYSVASAYQGKDFSALTSSLKSMAGYCSDLTTSIKVDATPKSAKKAAEDYKSNADTLCGAVSDMNTAISQQSAAAFDTARIKYTNSAQDFNSASRTFYTKAESIAKDIKTLAEPVQQLADKL